MLKLPKEIKEIQLPIIIEEPDAAMANQLALSGEFRQPEYSKHRDCYIFIRKKERQ